MRGDGNFMLSGTRYPFRVSSGETADGNGTRVRLNIDPAARALSADLDGVLSFEGRAPRFDGALTLAAAGGSQADGDARRITPGGSPPRSRPIHTPRGWSKSRPPTARKTARSADRRWRHPLRRLAAVARPLSASSSTPTNSPQEASAAEPLRLLPGLRALMAAMPQAAPIPAQIEFSAEQIMLGGRPLQGFAAGLQAGANLLARRPAGIPRARVRPASP